MSQLGNAKSSDAELQLYYNHITETGYRLDNTLRNLLKIVQLKDNPLNLSLVTTEMIIESISDIENSFEQNKIRFVVNIPANLQFITDFDLFNTITKNILDNALKFHDETRKDPYVRFEITDEDESIKIEIEDNGEGIEGDIETKVYDMFYRGNGRSKGSGLGLFLVKRCVQKLNGRIEFKSQLNKGTTFQVYLNKNLENVI